MIAPRFFKPGQRVGRRGALSRHDRTHVAQQRGDIACGVEILALISARDRVVAPPNDQRAENIAVVVDANGERVHHGVLAAQHHALFARELQARERAPAQFQIGRRRCRAELRDHAPIVDRLRRRRDDRDRLVQQRAVNRRHDRFDLRERIARPEHRLHGVADQAQPVQLDGLIVDAMHQPRVRHHREPQADHRRGIVIGYQPHDHVAPEDRREQSQPEAAVAGEATPDRRHRQARADRDERYRNEEDDRERGDDARVRKTRPHPAASVRARGRRAFRAAARSRESTAREPHLAAAGRAARRRSARPRPSVKPESSATAAASAPTSAKSGTLMTAS